MIKLAITRNNAVHSTQEPARRFLTLDICRGIAILGMLILHIISDTLNIDELLSDINSIPLINLLALVILPFFGGLAGFFLLISAVGNMVSMYRQLNKGNSVKGIIFKQVFAGLILLVFAMLSEGLIGYHGTFGSIFQNLDNISETNWYSFLWRWNTFETVHTIAWCLIINGIVQGLLSLKGNWKNTKKLIISYIILAVVVVGLTQPIWTLMGRIIPYYPSLGPYPFGTFPSGHELHLPWIGTESFWEILRTPFANALAAPWEPIFPYLAVSFIGSIIGIIISQPKEKISKKFPRRMFLVGLTMFISGVIGIVIILMQIMSQDFGSVDSFDVAIRFYQFISYHRHWAPDAAEAIYPGVSINIPPFSWVTQFIALNGFGIMILMFMFRFIEFRGKANGFADKTKIIRRYGTVAFSNYNNQYIYFIVFFLTSLMIFQNPYQRLFWGGTILTIVLTFAIFSLLLWGWEKIKYTGSLEWFIRTMVNNIVPQRRRSFNPEVKWWQKGQIDVERYFYNVDWIELKDVGQTKETASKEVKVSTKEKDDSIFALILGLVGVFSFLFMIVSILGLFASINARKTEGKNKLNTASFVLSIVGCTLFLGVIVSSLILKVGVLGLF